MSFNILNKKVEAAASMHLKDADGVYLYADEAETLPVTIEFYGRSSKQYRAWLQASIKANEKRGKKTQSVDEMMQSSVDMYVALSKAATNFDLAGEPINSPEAFRKLYSDPALHWINDQANEFLADASNFSKQ